MMASAQEILVSEVYHCYHCGSESTESSFKYFDNKKADQPRYKCQNCHKYFTLGSHGRQQGKTYAKKRNEDPVELKSLSRQCCHCGVADHAVFKYYNNNSPVQPRFKCLSCDNQFQMRLMGVGMERRLVHTSSQQRAPCRQKQLPQTSDEDAEFSNFLEAELQDEENIELDPHSGIANGDNGHFPTPLSDEFVEYLRFLEADLFTEENNETPHAHVFCSTTDVDGELPPAWSNEDEKMMEIIEAAVMAPNVDMGLDHMAKMASESTSDNSEVMYGTLVVNTPIVSDSKSWSHNGTSMNPASMSYVDDARACCQQMAQENSVQTFVPECSSSNAGSTIATMLYADPFRVIPEPLLLEQASKEDEQGSNFEWNEDDEAEEDTDSSECR